MSEKREQSIVTIWPANATVQVACRIQDRWLCCPRDIFFTLGLTQYFGRWSMSAIIPASSGSPINARRGLSLSQ